MKESICPSLAFLWKFWTQSSCSFMILYPVFQDQSKPFIGSCLFNAGPDCLCIWCSNNILTEFLLFYLSEQKDFCLLFLGKDDVSYPFSEAPITALHDANAEVASGPVHNCEFHIQVSRLDRHLYLWGVQATISTNNVYLPLNTWGLPGMTTLGILFWSTMGITWWTW